MSTAKALRRMALIFGAALLGSNLLMAQAGSLDPTFGTGGIVTTPSVNGCNPCSLAIQSDGKILVAGGASTSKGLPEVAVARYNTNGSLDTTFGTGGIVTTSQDDISSGAAAMALQPDGKIVVLTVGELDLLVIRYNSNGSLDATFGSGGFASLRPFNDLFFPPITGGIAVESNGDILLAAQSAAARLLSNGQLDSTFGTAGAANLLTSAQALSLLSNGQFLIVNGFNFTEGGEALYNSNGSLDTSFGVAGQTPSLGMGVAVVPLSNGKFVVAGTLDSGAPSSGSVPQGFLLARYNADGTLDSTFGSRGASVTNFPNEEYSAAIALALQSNGDIVAVGVTEAQNPAFGQEPSDFALARYTANGQLDTTFGTNGLVTTVIGLSGSGAIASGVAIQSDGKIVVAGDDTPPQVGDPNLGFVLARYLAQ
jgi:uncharacterized delta-60 repeat protein